MKKSFCTSGILSIILLNSFTVKARPSEASELLPNILITSGHPRSDATRSTEVVNLEKDLRCPQFNNYPLEVSTAFGFSLADSPVVCGGYFFDGDHHSENRCYRFQNNKWSLFATMTDRRAYAAAITYRNKIHIFGGYDYPYSTLKSTETIDQEGKATVSVDLPIPLESHSISAVNSTTSFISGGFTDGNSYSKKTWYYDHATMNFHPGPDLREGRYGHASSVITYGKMEIIVITGGKGDGYETLDSTELLIDEEWQQGPPMPKKIKGHSMISYNGDAYAIGGKSPDGYEKAIYRLSCPNQECQWTTLQQELKTPRQWFVAIPIMDSLVDCN